MSKERRASFFFIESAGPDAIVSLGGRLSAAVGVL